MNTREVIKTDLELDDVQYDKYIEYMQMPMKNWPTALKQFVFKEYKKPLSVDTIAVFVADWVKQQVN